MLGDPAQSDDEERELISLPAKGGKEDRTHRVFDSGMRFRGVKKAGSPSANGGRAPCVQGYRYESEIAYRFFRKAAISAFWHLS